MTTSNIICFPGGRSLQAESAPNDAGVSSVDQRPTGSAATALAAVISAGATVPPEDDREEYATAVIGAAIRFGKRKGQSLRRLPQQLRRWLLTLCDEGHPAALVVRDWLNGNQRFQDGTAPAQEGEGA
jgi:hypothetical protein